MAKPDSVDARRAAFLTATRDRVVASIKPALQPDAEPNAMSQAVRAIHSLTDENIALIEQTAERKRKHGTPVPQIACKTGCDYCCNMRVTAAVPEVLAIAEYIRANWSGERQTKLLDDIAEYQKQFQGLTPVQRLKKMIPCPLLDDHLCSIYPVRPIACRKYHSMDLQACIRALEQPDKVQVPHYLEVTTVVAPILTGLQTAMRERNLKHSTVILIPALEIALKNPDSSRKWLNGEDVFASALDKGIEQLAFVKMKKLPTYEV